MIVKPAFFDSDGSPMKSLVFRTAALVFTSVVLASSGGCSGGGKSADPARDQYENPTFGAKRPAQGTASAEDSRWTIVLAYFTGESHALEAERALARVRSEGGLPRARVQLRGSGSAVVIGAFDDPHSAELQQELRKVRAVEVDGRQAYPAAFAAPPPDSAESIPTEETDLRMAAEQFGKDALYTLQVAVFGRDDNKPPSEGDLQEFRKLAEQTVAKLRKDGDLAFYYHGPQRSTVTLGVFGPDDADPQRPGRESADLKALRERFPNNLLNGKAIRETTRGSTGERLQPSFLVAIPRTAVQKQ